MLGALQHPLYHPGGTACVVALAVERRPRVGYRQQPIHVSLVCKMMTWWRRQLEDTWPIDGLCIYKYQLATQVDRRQVHPSRLDSDRRLDLRLAKHQKSLTP